MDLKGQRKMFFLIESVREKLKKVQLQEVLNKAFNSLGLKLFLSVTCRPTGKSMRSSLIYTMTALCKFSPAWFVNDVVNL